MTILYVIYILNRWLLLLTKSSFSIWSPFYYLNMTFNFIGTTLSPP